jgi:hypothetical protein
MNYMFNLDDYETVEVRLEKFIKDFPDFRVETELVSFQNDRYIVKAWLYRTFADSTPFSSGLAEETISSRGVNATSALENCETSAIGRALANAGYASKGKRASREEMVKVTKARLTESAEKHLTFVNEFDPWTIKTVAAPATSAEAVATVKEIIGGTSDKDLPRCPHGEMHWATGTSKQGKPWGHFKCMNAATGEMNRCAKGEDIIWYEIAPNGSWRPQKVRA